MVTLELVKMHLRLEADDFSEDAYLTHLISCALDAFVVFTNRALIAADANLPNPVGNTMRITSSVKQGVLLLIGQWYVNREAVVIGVSVEDMPMATKSLWTPYRWANI